MCRLLSLQHCNWELTSVPPYSIRKHKQAADGSFTIRKVGPGPVKLGKYRLMTMSETHSAAEATGAEPDESVSLHQGNVSEGEVDRHCRHAEEIRDLQDAGDQSADGGSALQRIKSLCGSAELDVPATVLEVRMLTAQRLAAIPENKILSATLSAVLDAFKHKKEAWLSELNKLRVNLSSRQGNASTEKLAELYRTFDPDVGMLGEELRKREEHADGLYAFAD